jgi:hypothetical protein
VELGEGDRGGCVADTAADEGKSAAVFDQSPVSDGEADLGDGAREHSHGAAGSEVSAVVGGEEERDRA